MLLNHRLIILIYLLFLLNSGIILIYLWVLVVFLGLVNELTQYCLVDSGTLFSLNKDVGLTEDLLCVINFWVFVIKLLFIQTRSQDKSISGAF